MTKVISISDDIYEDLAKIKEEKSFSEILRILANDRKRKSLIEFSGKWKGDTTSELLDSLDEMRK